MRPVLKDPDLLLPVFREKAEAVFTSMQVQGYKPVLFETLRTPARAQALRRKGTSRAKRLSMHCYGAAADFICATHRWRCRRYGCAFYQVLGETAKAHGLWWGGDMFPKNRWTGKKFVDMPHVQAVPFKLQNKLRASNDLVKFVAEVLSA